MGARGAISFASLALLLSVTACPLGTLAAGAQEGRDQVLPGCGICYPGGYDLNTVGEVRGAVAELQVPAEGPVRFVLAGENERWVVLASPVWFWNGVRLHLAPGDSVTVHGSKTLGADGRLYLVAREIRPPDGAPAVALRDRRGLPLWSGRRRDGESSGGEERGCRVPERGGNHR